MKRKNDLTFNAKFNGKERFGFRKLSIGLATVALGTTFFLSNGQLVHADENDSSQQTASTEKVEEKALVEPKIENQLEDKNTSAKDSQTDAIKENQNSDTTPVKTTQLYNSSLESNEIPKDTLRDEKTIKQQDSPSTTQPSYSSTVTAKKNSDGISTDVTNTTQTLVADQDAIEVDTTVNLTGVKEVTKDKPITVQIVNSHTEESSDTLHINDKINDRDNWHFEKNSTLENAFNAWYTGTNLPTSVTFRINVQAYESKAKEYLAANPNETSENIPIGVKITYPTGKSETKHAFDAKFIPGQDIITKEEILKGFRIKETTVDNEQRYGNITSQDINDYNLNNDTDKVLQWGLYFNYSSSLKPNQIATLKDAIFSATFQNQIYLPNSIKIFEVPVKYVSNGNGVRYGIDDVPAGEKSNVYNLITTGNYERPAFELYLKANSNKDGFAIDQSKDGTFYVPSNNQKDTSYSQHAYFIQVDTVVKSKTIGNGVALTISQKFEGTGNYAYTSTVKWNNTTDGTGDDAQNTQQAIIKYYDDTTQKYLDINNQSSDISISGVAGETIDFGTPAQQNYTHFINKNYDYVKITIDSVDGTTILNPDGSIAKFTSTGIFPKFDNNNDNADGSDSHPQIFIVHFKHATKEAKEATTVTEHVSYYYENGPKKGQQVPDQFAPKNYELHFIRKGTTDLVTNTTDWKNWTLDTNQTNSNTENSFKVISFSELPQTLDDNYKLDPNGTFIVTDNTGKHETEQLLIIKGNDGSIKLISFSNDEITRLPNGASINIQVPYSYTQPSQPSQPSQQPSQPVQPSQPSQQPSQPAQPSQPSQQPTQPVQPTDHDSNIIPKGQHHRKSQRKIPSASTTGTYINTSKKDTTTNADTYTNTNIPKGQTTNGNIKGANKQNTLPQTGEKQSNLGVIGLGVLALVGLFGLGYDKKRRN